MTETKKPTPDEIKNNNEKTEGVKLELLWGRGHPTRENYSAGIECLTTGCGYQISNAEEPHDSIIGVKSAPWHSHNGKYAIIHECPKCFSTFWYHEDETGVKLIKEYKNQKDN